MRVWQILPSPNLGRLVEPDEFRAARNPRGNGRSLVRDISERFPSQPSMLAQHPAMQGDSAMYAGKKPVFLMHPIDGRYFAYALKLSNKINAIKRSVKTVENELAYRAAFDASAVQKELQNLDFRIESGAGQRLTQSLKNGGARLEAFDKMAAARAVGYGVVSESLKSGDGLSGIIKNPMAALKSGSSKVASRMDSSLPPIGIEAPVMLASQSAAAAAVGAYQSIGQMHISSNISNVLGTVPSIASTPAINLKI